MSVSPGPRIQIGENRKTSLANRKKEVCVLNNTQAYVLAEEFKREKNVNITG